MDHMNLKTLLGKYTIEIPMIQRDYAQGRVSQEEIAKNFLDAIFEVLSGNRKSLQIDFIYGYKEADKFILIDGVYKDNERIDAYKEEGKSILIDGQQRITTLWLLHVYLYKKAGCVDEIKSVLKNFSYNTRGSSKNFCKNLLNKDFDMGKKPSTAIRDMGGEFEKAENLDTDPTIKAMLHMLDLIFERVKTENDIKTGR